MAHVLFDFCHLEVHDGSTYLLFVTDAGLIIDDYVDGYVYSSSGRPPSRLQGLGPSRVFRRITDHCYAF